MIDKSLLHMKNFLFHSLCDITECFWKTHFHCSCHYLVTNSEIFRWEFIVFEIEGHHVGEDANHGVITEGINAKNVEVPQEAGCHSIPPTTRGAHS